MPVVGLPCIMIALRLGVLALEQAQSEVDAFLMPILTTMYGTTKTVVKSKLPNW